MDSVGAKRTSSTLHPYANQTINQLLSEMDGFKENEGIIVLGATNRRDQLDKALLRPGRLVILRESQKVHINEGSKIFLSSLELVFELLKHRHFLINFRIWLV